jgi:hypothetical protein
MPDWKNDASIAVGVTATQDGLMVWVVSSEKPACGVAISPRVARSLARTLKRTAAAVEAANKEKPDAAA